MFGHDDSNSQQDNQGGMPLPQPDGTLSHTAAPVAPAPHAAPALPALDSDDDQASASAPTVTSDASDSDDSAGDFIMTDAPQAADADTAPAADVPSSTPAPASSSSVSTDDLLDIKQGALQQLTPLLGHLDQTPEEKFRTTMMMIQAADNQELLKNAYEAAQQIDDEKTRAQALLDVVNEINYFTQQGAEDDQAAGSGQDA